MNLRLTKKNIIYSTLGILVTAGSLTGGYYFWLNPLKTEIELTKNELSTEEKLYETLADRVSNENNEVIENTMKLQRKLPVEPFLEQFLLDLEKAEVISNSFIEQMTFADADMNAKEIIETTPPAEKVENTEQELQADAANNEAAPESEAQASEQTVPTIPEEMKRITVTLTVNSTDYFDMLKFLEVIEHLERITKVDSLTFSGGEEIKSIDDEIEELSFTLVLSTFYYPKLEELKKELPPFETPPPSNKKNPLPTGIFLQEDSTVEEKNQTQTIDTKGYTEKAQSTTNEDSAELKEGTKSVKKQAILSGNSQSNTKDVVNN